MINLEQCDFKHLSDLASQAKYGGNPEHKMNPGDFNLTPPSSPRAGKSLCDSVKVFTRREAFMEEWLKERLEFKKGQTYGRRDGKLKRGTYVQ